MNFACRRNVQTEENRHSSCYHAAYGEHIYDKLFHRELIKFLFKMTHGIKILITMRKYI